MPPKFSPIPIGGGGVDSAHPPPPPPPLPPVGQSEATTTARTTTLDYNNAKEWIPIPSGSRQSTSPRHEPLDDETVSHFESHTSSVEKSEPDVRSNFGIKNFEGEMNDYLV